MLDHYIRHSDRPSRCFWNFASRFPSLFLLCSQFGASVIGIEWTIGLIRCTLISKHSVVLETSTEAQLSILKAFFNVGLVTSAVLSVYYILANDNDQFAYILVTYHLAMLIISTVMQVVAAKKLYKFNVERLRIQNSSHFGDHLLVKHFKAPASRLILTIYTCSNLALGLFLGDIVLISPLGNQRLADSFISCDPENYTVSMQMAFGFAAVFIMYATAMILSWVTPTNWKHRLQTV
jgi:hypothetical protein